MSRLDARRRLLAVGVTCALAFPIATFSSPVAVASDSGRTNFVTLAKGDDGPRVALVQRALNVRPVNGHFNDETKHSVRRFQDARGIRVTGVVNERTMNAVQSKWDSIQKKRAQLRQKYHRIMDIARNQKGDPYRYGAAGPSAFDCSGFTLFVYARATNMQLEHRATAQFQKGKRITKKQARPGDLVFMHDGGDIYHVSIYAGHGQIWHSSRPGTNVKRDPIWTNSVYYARLLDRP